MLLDGSAYCWVSAQSAIVMLPIYASAPVVTTIQANTLPRRKQKINGRNIMKIEEDIECIAF